MHNKQVLIEAIKNLGKAKAPARKKDVAVNQRQSPYMQQPSLPTAKEGGESEEKEFVNSQEHGVDTPIYVDLRVGKSKIHGEGVFSNQPVKKGTVVGISHVRKEFEKDGEMYQAPFPSKILGLYNHNKENPNITEIDNGDYISLIAIRDIQPGEELVSNYYNNDIKDLEKPEDFKNELVRADLGLIAKLSKLSKPASKYPNIVNTEIGLINKTAPFIGSSQGVIKKGSRISIPETNKLLQNIALDLPATATEFPPVYYHGTHSGALKGISNIEGLANLNHLAEHNIIPQSGELITGTLGVNQKGLSTAFASNLDDAVSYSMRDLDSSPISDFKRWWGKTRLDYPSESPYFPKPEYYDNLYNTRLEEYNKLGELEKSFIDNKFPMVFGIHPKYGDSSRFWPVSSGIGSETAIGGKVGFDEITNLFVPQSKIGLIQDYLQGRNPFKISSIQPLIDRLSFRHIDGQKRFYDKNYQTGGSINDRVLRDLDRDLKDPRRSKRFSKSLLATNQLFAPNYLFNKPSSRRIYNPNAKYFRDGGPMVKQRRGVRENSDGFESTHLMRAEYVPGRGWVGFPSLFQDSKPYADDSQNWVDMSEEEDWMKIYEEAERRGEVYDFGEDKEAALAFGEGSWKNQLSDEFIEAELSEEEIQKYVDGGYIVEELPKADMGKIVKSLIRAIPSGGKPNALEYLRKKYPNLDLRGNTIFTGNVGNLGVNELNLRSKDLLNLTDYEKLALSFMNQNIQPSSEFNKIIQNYQHLNTDKNLALSLGNFASENPDSYFEVLTEGIPNSTLTDMFNDPNLNIFNAHNPYINNQTPTGDFNPYTFLRNNLSGELEKNLMSYGNSGFVAANVPLIGPTNKANYMVTKSSMFPDPIVNAERYRGFHEMDNKHNHLMMVTNKPSLIISGNKGYVGSYDGNDKRLSYARLANPSPGRNVPLANQKIVPHLTETFDLNQPFDGTFMKFPNLQYSEPSWWRKEKGGEIPKADMGLIAKAPKLLTFKPSANILDDLLVRTRNLWQTPEGISRLNEMIVNTPALSSLNVTPEIMVNDLSNLTNLNHIAHDAVKQKHILKKQRLDLKNKLAEANMANSGIDASTLQNYKDARKQNLKDFTEATKLVDILKEHYYSKVGRYNSPRYPWQSKERNPFGHSIALGPKSMTAGDVPMVGMHEITHFPGLYYGKLSPGSTTRHTYLDEMLANLELISDSELKSSVVDYGSGINYNMGNLVTRKANPHISSKNYFKNKLQEKSPFLAEVKENMLQDGFIKHPYETMTPNKLKTYYNSYINKTDDKYPLRYFDIMRPTESNFKLSSDVFNKMLIGLPAVGAAALGSDLDEKAVGGPMLGDPPVVEDPLMDAFRNPSNVVRYPYSPLKYKFKKGGELPKAQRGLAKLVEYFKPKPIPKPISKVNIKHDVFDIANPKDIVIPNYTQIYSDLNTKLKQSEVNFKKLKEKKYDGLFPSTYTKRKKEINNLNSLLEQSQDLDKNIRITYNNLKDVHDHWMGKYKHDRNKREYLEKLARIRRQSGISKFNLNSPEQIDFIQKYPSYSSWLYKNNKKELIGDFKNAFDSNLVDDAIKQQSIFARGVKNAPNEEIAKQWLTTLGDVEAEDRQLLNLGDAVYGSNSTELMEAFARGEDVSGNFGGMLRLDLGLDGLSPIKKLEEFEKAVRPSYYRVDIPGHGVMSIKKAAELGKSEELRKLGIKAIDNQYRDDLTERGVIDDTIIKLDELIDLSNIGTAKPIGRGGMWGVVNGYNIKANENLFQYVNNIKNLHKAWPSMQAKNEWMSRFKKIHKKLTDIASNTWKQTEFVGDKVVTTNNNKLNNENIMRDLISKKTSMESELKDKLKKTIGQTGVGIATGIAGVGVYNAVTTEEKRRLERIEQRKNKKIKLVNNKPSTKNTNSPLPKNMLGGPVLGDEVDEATMKRLKEQGYTFEKI